ncbi:hypothetical protein HMSSN036_94430 [Paenibacillus macerans]|nr:hypothetical protein HMSSN036_94430 [Paenibacillus macerans]
MTVKNAVPYLKQRGGGSIIITSSINGSYKFSGFGMSAYSTTKAGQVAFAKMLALELAKFKIRVNAICPGAIATNIDASTEKSKELQEIIIPVKYPEGSQPLSDGPGQPENVADLVAFWPPTKRFTSPAPKSSSTARNRCCSQNLKWHFRRLLPSLGRKLFCCPHFGKNPID